ncbi:hypothetical protein NE237_003330 [Protea cynaroides]|uniref:Uncharacterized protein n=1 Tax=Protea cynaroides TaxID=273540 RepID=A0A9Q0KH63_9MAGN|nr:hypothetical protein NE237_003330 [Protea cynaroides]
MVHASGGHFSAHNLLSTPLYQLWKTLFHNIILEMDKRSKEEESQKGKTSMPSKSLELAMRSLDHESLRSLSSMCALHLARFVQSLSTSSSNCITTLATTASLYNCSEAEAFSSRDQENTDYRLKGKNCCQISGYQKRRRGVAENQAEIFVVAIPLNSWTTLRLTKIKVEKRRS